MAYKNPADPRAAEKNRRNSAKQRAKRTPEQLDEARAYARQWREANKEKVRGWHKRYNEENKDKIKTRNAARVCAPGKPEFVRCSKCEAIKDFDENNFYKRNTNKYLLTYVCRACINLEALENSTQKKYGLSQKEAKALRSRGCFICGGHERIHIDHCHETGIVRGALCSACNTAIGLMMENPDRIRKAAAYVENWSVMK